MFSCNVIFTLYAPRQSDRLMKFYYPKSCKTDSYIFTAQSIEIFLKLELIERLKISRFILKSKMAEYDKNYIY